VCVYICGMCVVCVWCGVVCLFVVCKCVLCVYMYGVVRVREGVGVYCV